MPHEAFGDLERGNFIERVRTSMGAQVANFNLHEAQAPTEDHPAAGEESAAFVVTEESLERPVGSIVLQNIEDGSANIAVETPDGYTMDEPLMRRVVPAAMESSNVSEVILDAEATNVPLEKLQNSGFHKQNDGKHVLHIRPSATS